MRVALLFTDGVGIGRRDAAINPLARGAYLLSQFDDGTGEALPGGGRLVALDACFGVPGRPQSASNQTALLTGEPAPALIGRHVLGFPDAPLRELIAQRSIVRRLAQSGRRAELANCYPAGYLDALGLPRRSSRAAEVAIPERQRRRLKPSAMACAFWAGGVPLRTLDNARQGEGLTHDVLGHRARRHGFDVPVRQPAEAAAIFWSVARTGDFCVFEHYLADEAGHARDFAAAQEALEAFDQFARQVVAQRAPDEIVLVCSDHGNVEDLSTRGHTLAQVPLLVFSEPRQASVDWRNLAHVGSGVLALLQEDQPSP